MSRFTSNQVVLNAVASDTTSDPHDVSMRHKLSAEVVLENGTGSGTVGFSVSNDGTNFVTYNRITTNVTDTNTQEDTRVATVSVTTAAPRVMAFFPASDYFRYIKAIFTVVTGAILTSEIADAGTGYQEDDVLTIADGSGGTITVLTVGGSGEVLTYALTTPGTGYSIGVHAATGGAGSDFELDVLTADPGDASVILQNID
jgi:hypothetical protein